MSSEWTPFIMNGSDSSIGHSGGTTENILREWLERQFKAYKIVEEKLKAYGRVGNFDVDYEANDDDVSRTDFYVRILNWKTESFQEWKNSSDSPLSENEPNYSHQRLWHQPNASETDSNDESSFKNPKYFPFHPVIRTEDVTKESMIKMHVKFSTDPERPPSYEYLHIVATERDEGTKPSVKDDSYKLQMDNWELLLLSRAIFHIQEWVRRRGKKYKCPFPYCFYGKKERSEKRHIKFNFFESALDKIKAGLDYLRKPKIHYTHSLLILQDFEPEGFHSIGKKSFSNFSYLSLFHVRAAAEELAKFHATTWAFKVHNRINFNHIWAFMVRPEYLNQITSRIKIGLPRMVEICQAIFSEDRALASALNYLIKLESRVDALIKSLIKKRKPQIPTCIIHQDLNPANILFKQTLVAKSKGSKKDSKSRQTKANRNNNAQYHESSLPLNSESALQSEGNSPTSSRKRKKENSKTESFKGILEEIEDKKLTRECRFINWKMSTIGSPIYDLAFLLFTCLPPKTREEQEINLLDHYWEFFSAQAEKFNIKPNCEFHAVQEEYYKGLLYSCLVICGNLNKGTIECLDFETVDIFFSAIKKASQHIILH